ncbi:MAG: carbohydrate porin, partial [bacterium]
ELFYQQEIGKLFFLLGQHDVNTFFSTTENASDFTNSSFGISPTISLNVPVPTFPIAALGAMVKYNFNPDFYIATGIYDGEPGFPKYGINFDLAGKQGILSTTEIGLDIQESLGTSLKVGGFIHTGTFEDIVDTTNTFQNNSSLYLLVEQEILKRDICGLNSFLQVGYSPGDQNLIKYYLGSGLIFDGLLGKKGRTGLGMAAIFRNPEMVRENNNLNVSEWDIEFFHRFSVNDHIDFQPGLHYIIQPGAMKEMNNAFVAMFRINIEF